MVQERHKATRERVLVGRAPPSASASPASVSSSAGTVGELRRALPAGRRTFRHPFMVRAERAVRGHPRDRAQPTRACGAASVTRVRHAGAVGAPTSYVHPGLGVQNIVYRDTDGRLNQLWRDTSGRTGTTNLTAAANAPTATGNPSAYIDTNTVQQIVVYRGTNNHVGRHEPGHLPHRAELFELWWVDNAAVRGWDLTAASGRRQALSDPAAYYSAGANTKHVIYRSGNDHLYEIWWVPGSGASRRWSISH